MKIEMHKKYKNKRGEPVEIIRVDLKHPKYPVLGITLNSNGHECVNTYTTNGDFYFNNRLDDDLVEVSSYDDWEIDAKIEFSNEGTNWTKGHFAGTDEAGYPLVWINGRTSFTTYVSRDTRRPVFIRLYAK